MPPPPKKKPKPEDKCLVCQAPQGSKPGAIFNGKGTNTMVVRFWLCADCAAPLSATPGARLTA